MLRLQLLSLWALQLGPLEPISSHSPPPPPRCACSAVFAPVTANRLGARSVVSAARDAATRLVVDLDFAASIQLGQDVEIADGAAVSNLQGRPAAASKASLAGPSQAAAPSAVIAGPASVGAACASASAAPVVFDASSSPLSAGRPIATYAWSSSTAALQALATSAGSTPRLVVPAAEAAKLAAGSYTLQLTVTNWLGATGKLSWGSAF